jgi:flagellar P-ring protein precursor FlgI
MSRIKDIATIQSVRENQLVGYGLVIGLQGTGDGLRNSPFTEQSVRSMLDAFGITAEPGASRLKNVASVMVTANLPPFINTGARIDINVGSLGDATSLRGGTLIMTPLRGPDGVVYAVAQGSISVTGFTAEGDAGSLTQGVPTAGRIPGGAIVEREVPGHLQDVQQLTLMLRNPDFSTAISVTDAVNRFAKKRFGRNTAQEQDARTIIIDKPKNISLPRFIAHIENLRIQTDSPARVVLDERSGTVVIGENVKVSRVAVTHGTLTVRVTELPTVVQPSPFSLGETAVEPNTIVTAEQPDSKLAVLDGAELQTLVQGLNILGVSPPDVIAILQAIKSAGALQAELVLQ